MGEIAAHLLELPRKRALGHFISEQFIIAMQHSLFLGERWLIYLLALNQLGGLAEDPRIGDRSAADHYTVNSGLAKSRKRLLWSDYVSAADDRNRDCSLACGYYPPIRFSAVALHTSAPVNGHHVSATVFNQAGHFDCIDRRIVPTRADLHRHRNRDGLSHTPKNL